MVQFVVDPGFDEMRYKMRMGQALPGRIDNYAELWIAVIEQAFRDGARELLRWIKSRDCDTVCYLASVDPDHIRLAAKKVLNGNAVIAPKPTNGMTSHHKMPKIAIFTPTKSS